MSSSSNNNINSNDDEEEESPNEPLQFEGKLNGERYIYHGFVEKIGKKKQNENRVLCLTRNALYQFNPYDNSLIQKNNLKEIYRIEPKSKLYFSIHFLRASSLLSGKKTKISGWGSGDSALNNVSIVDYYCDNAEQRYFWQVLIRRLKIDRWQCFIEDEIKLIPAPAIYQSSYFVTKVTRKKKLLPRFLILSSHTLYNVDINKKIEPKNIKWGISFEEILSVTKILDFENSFGLTVQIYPTTEAVKNKSMKEVTTFLLNNEHDRFHIISDLKRLIYLHTSKQLQVHSAEHKTK
eukprot:TRINITY_DN121_c0_g1_i1.p1 TRINITY_DN121_c0_g1~~TRINITY_DN121_c0_g1_i1.p1  ORF type:complete len:293 (+),score=62.81 TRINITY_DN121_c0_g1_i1:66-944(+)